MHGNLVVPWRNILTLTHVSTLPMKKMHIIPKFLRIAAIALSCAVAQAEDWLLLPAKPGTANGKKILLPKSRK